MGHSAKFEVYFFAKIFCFIVEVNPQMIFDVKLKIFVSSFLDVGGALFEGPLYLKEIKTYRIVYTECIKFSNG